MSALTKLFVVLLVVVSLLLSASVVVFVNRTENFRAAATTEKNKADMALADAANSKAEIAAATADRDAKVAEFNNRINDLNNKIAESQKAIDGVNLQLAQSQSNEQLNRTSLASVTQSLQAAQDQSKNLQTVVDDTRKRNDELVKKNFELNASFTDMSSQNAALLKQVSYLTEQHATDSAEIERIKKLVPPGQNSQTAAMTASANSEPINGLITNVENISGKPYATINVGSSSNVSKGMQFSAIDRQTGDFLGFVTIDTVEPESATGHIEGPSVDRIRKGVEVRTQLQ